MMQKESKIKPEFSTLSQTINILGSELGNVIKQQAGKSKFELVEEIRVNSKKYRSSKNSKFLNLIYERLKTLDEHELLILTKSFTLFFYLSNISEQVFREQFDYKIDKELIGGLKLQLGSFMIDTSIKNKWNKYKQELLES